MTFRSLAERRTRRSACLLLLGPRSRDFHHHNSRNIRPGLVHYRIVRKQCCSVLSLGEFDKTDGPFTLQANIDRYILQLLYTLIDASPPYGIRPNHKRSLTLPSSAEGITIARTCIEPIGEQSMQYISTILQCLFNLITTSPPSNQPLSVTLFEKLIATALKQAAWASMAFVGAITVARACSNRASRLVEIVQCPGEPFQQRYPDAAMSQSTASPQLEPVVQASR